MIKYTDYYLKLNYAKMHALKWTSPLNFFLSDAIRVTTRIASRKQIAISMATSISQPYPSLKSRLRKGDCLYGLFFDSFSPTIAEISGHAGYDFVIVDMEHGYGGISEALSCLHALAASQTPVILRLPECSAMWAKKALDLGPQGLMFPMIHTPQLAQEAVSYCRYPQAGICGVAHSITRASKYGLDPGYLDWCEEELLIMCQVESEEAVEKIQEITMVDGLDCVMVGPTDLSANMGYIRDPGNENAVKMVQTVENAVLSMKPKGDKRVFLAGFAMPHDEPSELKKRGYQMVCGAVDIVLYREAAVKDVLKFKTAVKQM